MESDVAHGLRGGLGVGWVVIFFGLCVHLVKVIFDDLSFCVSIFGANGQILLKLKGA